VTWYGYHTGATTGNITTLIKTVKNGSDSFEYTYDSVGNITQIKKNGTVYESYTYDSLNQLKTVTRGSDVYEYTYDNGGNIQSVTLNGETIKSYGYTDTNWKDKLTSFNGQTVTYDNIGNPLTYRDGYSFAWSNGRQLTGITQDTDNISYLYNADGLRASKTVNGTTTDYYWLEGVLLGQKTGNDYITYLYDENGAVYGIICNDTYYYYVFNAQGDVIGIIDADGNQVVQYDYSAWGEVLAITGTMADTLGQTNPIRYRGYYYDSETGFYYLQSRYYDPITQRFLNADGLISTGQGILGTNMFAYCGNNPVNLKDSTGQFFFTAIIVTVTAVVVNKMLSKANAKKNHKSNVKKETDKSKNKKVKSQSAKSVKNLDVGFGDVGNNGCGIIAIHNTKVLSDKESTLSDTIKDVQDAGGLLLGGKFGVNPLVIDDVLEISGIECTPVSLNELNTPGAYIIAFWNSDSIMDGAHFVTVEYDGNTYTSYNYNGDELNPLIYAKNYIYGYRIH